MAKAYMVIAYDSISDPRKLAAYMRPIRRGQTTYTVQPRTATALRFQPTGGSSAARCGSQHLIVRRCYRSLELARRTVKPFAQCELHGTVTICPELKIFHQTVTQK
jgi:hypothetical protein